MAQGKDLFSGEIPLWHEEYLEISPNIFSTFPKSRPPVGLYYLCDAWSDPRLYCKALTHLPPQRQAEVAEHCRSGRLFLHRSDYEDYARHLGKHLAVTLTEPSLDGEQIAEIFFIGLSQRIEEFFLHPVEANLERLSKDLAILCEHIWANGAQADLFKCLLGRGHDLISHSVKVCLAGTTMYSLLHGEEAAREGMVDAALGFILHDLGMVNVPRQVYEHEHRLLFANRKRIEEHTSIGLKMASRLRKAGELTVQCIGQHHERLDGSGYPSGCKGEAISQVARICAVADSFCAMTADRTYASAVSPARATSILMGSPTRYDQEAVRALAVLVLGEQAPEATLGGDTADRKQAGTAEAGRLWSPAPTASTGASSRLAGAKIVEGGRRTPVEQTTIRSGAPAFAPPGTGPEGDLRVLGTSGEGAGAGQQRTAMGRTTIRDGGGTTPVERTAVSTSPPVDMEGILENAGSHFNLWRRAAGDEGAGLRPSSRRKHRRRRLESEDKIGVLFWPSDPLSLPDGAVRLARPLFEAKPQTSKEVAGEHIVDISIGGIRLSARESVVGAPLPAKDGEAYLLLRPYVLSQERYASYLVRGIVRHASREPQGQFCLGIEFTELQSIKNVGGSTAATWENVRDSQGGEDFLAALAQLDNRV